MEDLLDESLEYAAGSDESKWSCGGLLIQDDLVQAAKVAAKAVAFGISWGAWIVGTSTEKHRKGKLTIGGFDDVVFEHVRDGSLEFSFKMKGDAIWPAVNGQGPWLELNVVDEDVGEFLREGLSKVQQELFLVRIGDAQSVSIGHLMLNWQANRRGSSSFGGIDEHFAAADAIGERDGAEGLHLASLGEAQLLKKLLRHDIDRRAVIEQGNGLVSMNSGRADANGEPNKIGGKHVVDP
ncbi:hypothetical protein GUITHDRAFT_105674 [Guillardia theta CCMP2712]|uniref:Uncharacterized protein n=1 Tax=Guillardia theta (strain CCMP2712) TaxID=905079 RepID=L1JK49_GUITC|nr:hypothetical protein GUITHDRAFT_105674 [Guillardia theta CCMP2712]EKX48529.1 hypothetical protein GUITHDRAFT_105674 [Guillardia theta CCMP2712]|eukprot:XP_005835509.1 hypothetical protein GUITHDRAFT_105674 [Guillardia theta CCMP2712]